MRTTTIYKHADPIDGARAVTVDEAMTITRDDHRLIHCDDIACDHDMCDACGKIQCVHLDTMGIFERASRGICGGAS